MSVFLPKWPACAVVGESVSTDDAAEILVRTFNWENHSNDKDWLRQVYDLADIKYFMVDGCLRIDYPSLDKFEQRYGVLELEYLRTARVYSSNVGGPYGWCNWDGKIHLAGRNVGSWPTDNNVQKSWALIAKTFPFLDLKCQLFHDEHTVENIQPVVQYTVRAGQVEVEYDPDLFQKMDPTGEVSFEAQLMDCFENRSGRERGVALKHLEYALAVTEKRVKASREMEKVP